MINLGVNENTNQLDDYANTGSASPLPEGVGFHSGFDPIMITTVTRDVLRFLFEISGPPSLKYNDDPKESNVAINFAFDTDPDSELQHRPAIIVQRGGYGAQSVGLTDSLAYAKMSQDGKQIAGRNYENLIQGNMIVDVRARNLGTCEILAAWVVAYLVWSRPYICNTLQLNDFAKGIQVSPVMTDKDETDIFSIRIQFNYLAEMKWSEVVVGVKLKGFLTELTRS